MLRGEQLLPATDAVEIVLIEQDHRGVKQRIAVMLGFQGFRNAAITTPALS